MRRSRSRSESWQFPAASGGVAMDLHRHSDDPCRCRRNLPKSRSWVTRISRPEWRVADGEEVLACFVVCESESMTARDVGRRRWLRLRPSVVPAHRQRHRVPLIGQSSRPFRREGRRHAIEALAQGQFWDDAFGGSRTGQRHVASHLRCHLKKAAVKTRSCGAALFFCVEICDGRSVVG